ncbi:MAG TPA: preprotein translocase subunit SecE [Gaiellaceae bacterium]|nr:preprotein translocase subunit SecE [Gaiellaceae bacterium]
MARETRGQRRRAKAKAAGKELEPKPVQQRQRARPQQQVRPAQQPVSAQTGRREQRPRGSFAKESWAELQKVDWPGRAQVLTGTVVVLIACVIVGLYLYGADQALRPLVRNILLGQ